MKPLSDIDLVALAAGCESGPPVHAALRALALAWPDVPATHWPALDHAQRDGLLLHLRRQHFGDRLESESVCPGCGERLEFELSARSLAGGDPAPPDLDRPPLTVDVGGVARRLRRPGTDDLERATDAAVLMRRCAEEPGDWCSDPAWQQAFGLALTEDAPLTDPLVALVCPACADTWEETFDIARFLAGDLLVAGQRLLDEVHVIALAYHWSEQDILALPRARRRHYLGRLSA
jgi:hypothetical protein